MMNKQYIWKAAKISLVATPFVVAVMIVIFLVLGIYHTVLWWIIEAIFCYIGGMIGSYIASKQMEKRKREE